MKNGNTFQPINKYICFRITRLLEAVCEASDPPVFYGALWECIASNSKENIRLPAISFILQHIDRTMTIKVCTVVNCTPVDSLLILCCFKQEQSHVLGNDLEVMVRAVCQAVQDDGSIYVQRNTLDLLILAFPLHESTLDSEEMADLVTAACAALLRRDMSLNRRFFLQFYFINVCCNIYIYILMKGSSIGSWDQT